jgi:hypothetical protein
VNDELLEDKQTEKSDSNLLDGHARTAPASWTAVALYRFKHRTYPPNRASPYKTHSSHSTYLSFPKASFPNLKS